MPFGVTPSTRLTFLYKYCTSVLRLLEDIPPESCIASKSFKISVYKFRKV